MWPGAKACYKVKNNLRSIEKVSIIIFKHRKQNNVRVELHNLEHTDLKMNCVFVCVFGKQEYHDMFKLLLESILKYGALDDATQILVYTTTEYMNSIKSSHLYSPTRIQFETNDNITNLDEACKSRMDLFTFESIKNNKYSKILYLDTDIIVKGPLGSVFDTIKDDIIYVLSKDTKIGTYEPGTRYDYMGDLLFTQDELVKYTGRAGFSSGIIGFNNCLAIRKLFDRIRDDMVRRQHHFQDQPFFVYHAMTSNLYNSDELHKYAIISNTTNIQSPYIIHHFAGTPGSGQRKYTQMYEFLNALNDNTITAIIEKTKDYITNNLLPIVQSTGELLEGNLFTFHNSVPTFTNTFLHKVKNISNLSMNRDLHNIMEIGFNSGFSALLILLSNPLAKLTCFDLCEHKYVLPCYLKLRQTFGERISLVVGDSMETLPAHKGVYDLIHIDGGHTAEVGNSDILHSYRLSRPGTLLILDDTDIHHLVVIWENYIAKWGLQPLETFKYKTPHHDIRVVPP